MVVSPVASIMITPGADFQCNFKENPSQNAKGSGVFIIEATGENAKIVKINENLCVRVRVGNIWILTPIGR